MIGLIGDYRYSGVVIDGRKYSIVRNGAELQRVREVFDHKNAKPLWNSSMPMTLEILSILDAEHVAVSATDREGERHG